MYIHHIIPKEKVLVKKYDNVRMKLKTIKNDETLQEELLNISAEIEVKLLLKNDDWKAELKILEIKQINTNSTLCTIPDGVNERKRYEGIIYKLKVIRALRSEMRF